MRNASDVCIFGRHLRGKVLGSTFSAQHSTVGTCILTYFCHRSSRRRGCLACLVCSTVTSMHVSGGSVTSLRRLTKMLFDLNSVSRTCICVDCYLRGTLTCQGQIEMINVSTIRSAVRRVCRRHGRERRTQLHVCLMLIDILSLVSLFTFLCVCGRVGQLGRSHRRLGRTGGHLGGRIRRLSGVRKRITRAGMRLASLGRRLESAGGRLHRSGCIGRRCVNCIFSVYSGCVDGLSRCQGGVGHGLGTGRLRSIGTLASARSVTRGRLGRFCRGFSTVFLRVCPSFMDSFGTLLRPSRRVILGSNRLLGARLHVCTLIHLNVASDIGVTRFLRCSPRAICGGHLGAHGGTVVPQRRFTTIIHSLNETRG